MKSSRLPMLHSLRPLALTIGVLLAAAPAWAAVKAVENQVAEPLVGPAVVRDRSLPDLARGQRAASEDRIADAEADLRSLAERGYLEAQIALGKIYARAGTPERIDAAIGWLRSAHRRAPATVEVPLGRLLLRRNDPASLDEAQRLLDSAYARRPDSEAIVGLLHLYIEHPERDREHRVAKLAERAEKIPQPETLAATAAWYRATPQVEDHPQHLVSLCGKVLDQVPECHVDLVRDARRAGDHARLEKLVDGSLAAYDKQLLSPLALNTVARALLDAPGDQIGDPLPNLDAVDVKVSDVEEDEGEQPLRQALAERVDTKQGCSGPILPPAVPGTPAASDAAAVAAPDDTGGGEPELASRVLKKMLEGEGLAPVLASGVIARYPDLLTDVDIEARLKTGVAAGIPEARLYLGTLYLKGNRGPRDPRLTLDYLQKATKDPLTSVPAHFFLGRLYQYGYLDESSPLLATQHLVYAARHGYAPADGALARLFTSGKGLCPNLVDAYVFTQLAVTSGSLELSLLLEQITTRLGPDLLPVAEQRLAEERAARPAAIANHLAGQASGARVQNRGDAS